MKFRTLPIVAILFIAAAMVVQFVISFSIEKDHVGEVVEYRMELAQKDFFHVLVGFHNAADEMRRYILKHPDNESDILDATRATLNRYSDIDNVFVKFAPGVYGGKVDNYFPRSYRHKGKTITTAQGAEGLNYYARDWYTGALQCDSDGYWSEPYIGASTQTLIASHSIKIEDEQGQLIGVVGDDFTIEWMEAILKEIKPYDEAVCLIYGTNGSLIASSDSGTPEDVMLYQNDKRKWSVYSQTMSPIHMQLMIAVPNHVVWQSIKWRSAVTLFVLIIGIVILILLFRRIEQNEKAYLQVENEHKIIQNEMQIAQNIQTGILVHDFIDDDRLALHATLVPVQNVGGDLYDFYRDGDDVTFIIGDVSGKGMPAAMFMSAAVTLFRSAVKHHSTTSAIMEEINSTLSLNNRSMMFVTAFVGRLHLPTGQLSFCNAGHLPPVIVKDGECRLLDLKETNLLLGIDSDYQFSEESTTIGHGEQIIIFTDGVTEAENVQSEQLGFDDLLKLLQAREQPIDDQTVYDIVGRFSSGAEQADDITIMSITRK
jgi:sigma-B regulation protein RsbU (phosphoserine phosphatase)